MTIAAKVVAAALLSVSASVQAFAAATDADSLNEAVAVFVASNIKLSVDNALSNLEKTGVSVDTAVVNDSFSRSLPSLIMRRHTMRQTVSSTALSRRVLWPKATILLLPPLQGKVRSSCPTASL